LFRATAETLRTIGAIPSTSAPSLASSRSCTWGQTLLHHPHVHCVSRAEGWPSTAHAGSPARRGSSSSRSCSAAARRLFLAQQLQAAFDRGRLHFAGPLRGLQDPAAFARYLAPLRQLEWGSTRRPSGVPRRCRKSSGGTPIESPFH
jgi:hypothetical protein